MLYKFRCAATGDLIMFAEDAKRMLQLMGRDPAPQGIVEPSQMPQALAQLQASADVGASPADAGETSDPGDRTQRPVQWHQRLWPFMEMLKRAQAAGKPITWGV